MVAGSLHKNFTDWGAFCDTSFLLVGTAWFFIEGSKRQYPNVGFGPFESGLVEGPDPNAGSNADADYICTFWGWFLIAQWVLAAKNLLVVLWVRCKTPTTSLYEEIA